MTDLEIIKGAFHRILSTNEMKVLEKYFTFLDEMIKDKEVLQEKEIDKKDDAE